MAFAQAYDIKLTVDL